MLPLGGPVTFKTPLPAEKARPTMRCSISKACVDVPFFMSTTEAIFAASGVVHLERSAVADDAGGYAGNGRSRGGGAVGVEKIWRRINFDAGLVGSALRISAGHPHGGVGQAAGRRNGISGVRRWIPQSP